MTPLLLMLSLLNPDSAARNEAGDWRYPGTYPGASGGTQHADRRIGTYSCQDIEGQFPQVLEWYAERAGAPELMKTYRKFVERTPDAAPQSFGSLADLDIDGDDATLGTVVFAFTDERQHVTLMPAPSPDGHRVVISIAASQGRTTVQIVGAAD